MRKSSKTLQIGDPAPDFTLKTFEGRPYSLRDFQDRFAVLAFIRGLWCTNSRRLLAGLEPAVVHFLNSGAGLAVVNPQKLEGYGQPRRFLEAQRFSFPVLFDEERQVCHSYGVYRAIGLEGLNTASPAVFFIDPHLELRSIWVCSTVRELPSPQQMLDELRRLAIPTPAL